MSAPPPPPPPRRRAVGRAAPRGGPQGQARAEGHAPGPAGPDVAAPSGGMERPPLRLMPTTLWDYPSQHYRAADGSLAQGSQAYAGATPSWVVWQLVQRYTQPGDVVLDPMCGSGTTLDVCRDTGRAGIGFDLAPPERRCGRADVRAADARALPVPDGVAHLAFVDPPYSTHVEYSDDPRCIGKLDAAGEDHGRAYYQAMAGVLGELARALRPGGHLGVYVSDSWRRTRRAGRGVFMPIGFELFAIARRWLAPVDIVAVVRRNAKLERGNWRRAAEDENFYLRGFNYLLIFRKAGR